MNIGIIGSGTMGIGIAHATANKEHKTTKKKFLDIRFSFLIDAIILKLLIFFLFSVFINICLPNPLRLYFSLIAIETERLFLLI